MTTPTTAVDAAQPAPDERLEELRLALVLNGGVSLAVWMGGVSFELNRLVRETHPVYQGLLRLTKTAARIDVISGTSAGGLNGAALALAQIHDKSLYMLRDVWLGIGGLDNLLHKPDDEGITSLLRGNEWFHPQILKAFDELVGEDPAPASQAPILLNLTTTLLDAESHERLDDFGAVIEDAVHRASWRFERLDTAAPRQDTTSAGAPATPAPAPAHDDFADRQIVARLAFAARATASFPVAFEPVCYEPSDPLFKASDAFRIEGRPPGDAKARLLLDGGILDNKPFEAALEAIDRLPASGDTRRVLAYIVPDPAAAADVRKPGPDQKLPQPTLAEVAWRSLVGIPMSQSIGAHMDQLKQHNAQANGRWQRVVGLVRHVPPDVILQQAGVMLPAYRARRVDGMIDYLLSTVERGLSERAGACAAVAKVTDMRRSTRRWLRSVWMRACELPAPSDADTHRAHVHTGLRWRIPAGYEPTQPIVTAGGWSWGLFGLEFMADVTLELLRRTQRLHALLGRWREDVVASEGRGCDGASAPTLSKTRGALEPDPVGHPKTWESLDVRSKVGRLLRTGATRVGDQVLQPIWHDAYSLAGKIKGRRAGAEAAMEAHGAAEFEKLVADWPSEPAQLESRAVEMLAELLRGPKAPSDGAPLSQPHADANAANGNALCDLIRRLQGPIEDVLRQFDAKTGKGVADAPGTESGVGKPSRADVSAAVEDLRALHRFFFGKVKVPGAADPLDQIAWRVLALEVFEFTSADRAEGPDTQPEVVQISARLPSIWGGSGNPAEKLNGMQLAHFGAFYKRSWRANDWTFGRLDGIDRAVRIALNPDSLQRRYGARLVEVAGQAQPLRASEFVHQYLRRLAVETAEPGLVDALNVEWDDELIQRELAWLDQEATVPPPVLEHCARALTRRLQLEALRAELPEIAASLRVEKACGAPPSSAGEALLERVPHGSVPDMKAVQALMKSNLIGTDSMAQQVGTDQFTRTASRALSTAHAALSGNGGLNAIHAVFKITDWPLRVLYLLSNRLMEGGRTRATLSGLALGGGLALVAAGVMADKLPAPLLALGWALLAGVFGLQLLEARGSARQLLFMGLAGFVAAVVAVACGAISPATAALGVASVVLVLLVYQPWIVIVLLIAAWTVHGTVDDWDARWRQGVAATAESVSGVTEAQCEKDAKPVPPLTPERLKKACERRAVVERMQAVQLPVLVLIVVLSVGALGRSWERWWRERGARRASGPGAQESPGGSGDAAGGPTS